MPYKKINFKMKSEQDTADLARKLGQHLGVGDVILLVGEIGAGKSFFARSLIQSVQQIVEDVPSPTFTLIQTYSTKLGEIWHADLYRLGAIDEVIELGLIDAFDHAICLVEWPEILGDFIPKNALKLVFETTGGPNERHISLQWNESDHSERFAHLN